ncbi:hypothetical protein [Kitasatospora fiedleri]|uniref:hypothetical protein n=1 Tax=Kitasatospora fiedleri TaxID=2991545 RepID=UPI00249CBDFE|nr:hypothetical protein [Kitasatospora fiedleri]
MPAPGAVTVARRITDRYVEGTRLRLRRVERLDTGECTYKLTQKVPVPPGEPGAVQAWSPTCTSPSRSTPACGRPCPAPS